LVEVASGPIIKRQNILLASYDGWRYSQADLGYLLVPTAAEIAGDFSNTSRASVAKSTIPYLDRASAARFVRDPFRCDASGNPLPLMRRGSRIRPFGTACNKIPQALILCADAEVLPDLSATPNFSDARDLTNNFIARGPTINNSNSYQGRVDHASTTTTIFSSATPNSGIRS
jgi:hypothetical protein